MPSEGQHEPEMTGFIRTYSLNPAVDVSLIVPRLEPIHKIRASSATREAGGGGVNVARVLARMDHAVDCVVATGGAQGAEVIRALEAANVAHHHLSVNGDTRESVQIIDSATADRYRVVVDGPPLADDPARHFDGPDGTDQSPMVVVLSGSLPAECAADTYRGLASAYPNSFVIVDTSGEALRHAVKGSVDLVKPSLNELESLVGRDVDDAVDLRTALEEILDAHPELQAILVSLGSIGAVLAERGEAFAFLRSPRVPTVSAIGAGDAMVAGVAARLLTNASVLDAARFGVACGAATVMTPGTELCDPHNAERLIGEVSVGQLEVDQPIRSRRG